MISSVKFMRLVLILLFLVSHNVCFADKSEDNLIKLILSAHKPEVFLYNEKEPFTLKNGEKSPVFLNFSNITDGSQISELGDIYADTIEDADIDFDMLYGSAYNGIPLVVTVARSLHDKHNLIYPFSYHKKETIEHGEAGLLIGQELAGKKVLFIDDILVTGKTVASGIEQIEKEGGEVVGVVVSVARQKSHANIPANIPIITITNVDNILKAKKQYKEKIVNKQKTQVVVALDVDTLAKVDELIEKLDPKLCKLKVGLQLYTAVGPKIIKHLGNKGFDVFLDLKYHDIPNTVYKAVYQAAELNVWMLTIHSTGSEAMLYAARRATLDFAKDNPNRRVPLIIGVTMLTSLADDELESTYKFSNMKDAVYQLAGRSKRNKLDGIECSPKEIKIIRDHDKEFGDDFLLVTPGIRMSGSKHDQNRIGTPRFAVKSGSDYLVVGRSITQSRNPAKALSKFLEEINSVS